MMREARQIGELAFVIAWICGAVLLLIRMRILQNEYFSRFTNLIYYPFFNVPFLFRPVSPYATLRLFRLTFTRQSDPSLESLRLKILKRWFQMGAWIFLFPIPFVIVLTILTSSGIFR